jgi:hypothetical protein
MNINHSNPWYITGFIEGEGAFTFQRSGKSITPTFSIRQRSDYSGLVKMISEFFGVGSVYECKARPPTRPSTYYRVSRLRDLRPVIRHFKRYPMMSKSKRAVFGQWSEMVRLKTIGQSNSKIISMAKTLSSMQMRPRGFTAHHKALEVTIPSPSSTDAPGRHSEIAPSVRR